MRNLSSLERDLDLAYVAGFVDGEGCIALTRRDGGKKGSYYVQIIVNNVDPRIPHWMAKNLGGRYFSYEPKQNNRRRVHRWHAYANEAVKVLKELRPFLRMKRDLADRAIGFQQKRMTAGWKWTRPGSGLPLLPADEIAWRASEYEWFKRRNQRGRPSIG